MHDEKIHIVGGGIGGLILALGLLRGGRDVRVYEQAKELGEVGAGLSISPNASLGLEYLGMLEFMETESNKPQMNYVFHGTTNEQLVGIDRTTDYERFGASYYQIHRADFHDELVRSIENLNPKSILLNHSLTNIKSSNGSAELTFASGEIVLADNVVGADGIKSVVRDIIFRDCSPKFTGLMAWRGLIPAVNIDSRYVETVSRVWVGPGRTFVTYPIRKSGLVNIVAFAQAPDWVEEGWSVRAEPEELVKAFDGYCDDVQALIKAIPDNTLFRWGLFSREPLDTLVTNNVALIGDAAHPMLPWFGQGASSTIEDSVLLARCILDSKDISTAFRRYNNARFERVTFLQKESNAGTERMQGFDPYVLRDAPRRDEDALGIFKYNPVTVKVA